jgi:hypothetical protein
VPSKIWHPAMLDLALPAIRYEIGTSEEKNGI